MLQSNDKFDEVKEVVLLNTVKLHCDGFTLAIVANKGEK